MPGRRRRGGVELALLALAAAACAPVHADEVGYEIRVAPELSVEPGAAASISVAIVPARGRSVSAEGPVRLAVRASDWLSIPRRRFTRRDAADPAADAPRFEIKLKARVAGDHPVTVELRFWLCGARVCRPITASRDVLVRAAAPIVDASAGPDGGGGGGTVDAGAPVDAGARRRVPLGRR